MAINTIHIEGAIRDLAGETLYAQIVSLTTGALVNAAEEAIAEAGNGHRSAVVDIGAATGIHALIVRYDSDDAFAGSWYVDLDEAAPVANEAIVDIDVDAIVAAIPAAVSQPYSSHAPQRVNGTKLTAFLGEGDDVSIEDITAYDANRTLLPLDGLELSLIVAAYDDPETPLAPPQQFTGSGSTFDLVLNEAFTSAEAIDGQAHYWSLRDGTEVIQHGRLEVKKTARSA
jgi:hypothetical protein